MADISAWNASLWWRRPDQGVEEDRASGGYAGEQDGHGDGFSSDEPAIGGGHERGAEAEVGRDGHEYQICDEKEDVVVCKRMATRPMEATIAPRTMSGLGPSGPRAAVQGRGEAGLGAREVKISDVFALDRFRSRLMGLKNTAAPW